MTAAADRHLLFGLLALQNGLINQGQLVAAFQAWTLDKSRSLADHLESRGDLSAARRPLVEGLAEVHLEMHAGDAEMSLADVAIANSTRESLTGVGDLDLEAILLRVGSHRTLTEHDGHLDIDPTIDYSFGTATTGGQRFRVLRPHAQGGLGAVFVALDNELHREVALKQILEKHADEPTRRARFMLEAEVTGGLEHPGIVPVYGLGTYADGRPYYAMRFIRGESLKEAIDHFHQRDNSQIPSAVQGEGQGGGWAGSNDLELRKLLRRFIDVCNAIDYAHSRGVLHRDIKPANIILGKHGETLVIDWGLAKVTGASEPGATEQALLPSSTSGSSDTSPGSALGTPAYMSPEQARGDLDRLGARSDVYSLGATLYCLVTGKPPFEGGEVGEIIQRVQHGDFVGPRRIAPSLDQALEGICLKAMALEPRDRYASPQHLTDDLDRWMANEPVTAWREPFSRQLVRWLSRHRTGVTGLSAAVLAGFVGLSAVLAVQSAANARLYGSLERETVANAELKNSKAAVQARYELASQAIKTLHTGVTENFLLKDERFKDVRERFLRSASDFYAKLGAMLGKETDLASRQALMQANFDLATLTDWVGRKEEALAEHRAVLAAREALAAQPGAGDQAKADVGQSLTQIAMLLQSIGKAEEALAAYRRSELQLAETAHVDSTTRTALATCRTRMGILFLNAGRTADAMQALTLARADQERLAAGPDTSDQSRTALATAVTEIGSVLWRTGRPAEAEREFRTAIPIFQRLVDENQFDVESREGLASNHFFLGNVLSETGKAREAETELRTGVSTMQKLSDENPAVTRLRRTVAIQRMFLGDLLARTDKPPAAIAEYRAALAILQKLVDDEPEVTDFSSPLALVRDRLGVQLLQMGKPAEAEPECRAALLIAQRLADDNRNVAILRGRLADCLSNLADVVRVRGRSAEAREGFDRAIALNEQRIREDPANMAVRYALARSLRLRGLARRDLGDLAGAVDDIRRALAECEGLPPLAAHDFEMACCHATFAELAGRDGSGIARAEGYEAANKAMELLRRAVARGYRNATRLKAEMALAPIRSREEFHMLTMKLMDLAVPAEVFAGGR
jgi:serine/threonine protein kinase/tetratricopeptide (TPR) repeat protein